MDIFDKCKKFTTAKEIMEMGYYPYFREIESGQDTEVYIHGKKMIMLGSNSYLGLTSDERVKEASIEAIKKYGTGNAGSRFLNGTLDIHCKLEDKLADLVHKEAALLYGTGYQTNVGVISALVSPKDYVITDKLDHASIIDGCLLSHATMKRFRHNDAKDLERVLSSLPEDAGKLVVVDGIFSMEGDIADLPSIIPVCKKYNARLMVDDAHAIGVIGEQGRGTASHFASKGLIDEKDVDLIMGTFSKSFASLGGFIAADEYIIHYLKHHSRALIFSASMPPATVAAVDKAIDIMLEEPERIEKLWHNTHKMKDALDKMGYNTGVSCTPIIPILIGDMMQCFKMWRALTDAGIFVNPVVPPAVQPNQSLIRVSFMATHTDEQLDKALDAFERIGKELGII